MKILFITSNRLGDGVLSTGVIAHFARLHPEAEITVACGPLVTGLFEAAPGVKRVIALRKEPRFGHWRKLARQTLGTKWDVVIDLRDSLLSRVLLARKKHIWNKPDAGLHKVEQIARVIGSSPPPAPALWFNAETRAKAEKLVPSGAPVLAVGPAANWHAKTWPAENFIALLEKITGPEGFLPEARIAIFAAPGEEQTARRVLDAFPHAQGIDVIAKAPPAVAAAAIARCDFYVGNDSGLMHCAAAAGVPTLGLFGPTSARQYRPWGPRAAHVSTPETMEQLIGHAGFNPSTTPCLMTSLTVEAAWAAAQGLWSKTSEKPASLSRARA
jgi:ADP-heptose:LPS heptosyltransferase